MKIKFDKLDVGMLTDQGLIVHAGPAGSHKFYGDEPFIKFFELNDPYHGQASRTVGPDEEFKVLHEPGTEGYKKVIQGMIKERVQAVFDAEQDIDLLRAYEKLGGA